eukprot:c12594_g1_i1.p1 GENE.c12594_g1_i1~~c12594_g1_i1.p1  ORF type:complete len:1253 (+),score=375.93 c12594_g1_i1:94-3759(+)
MTEEKSGCCGDCIEKSLTINTRIWAKYGRFVSTPCGSISMFCLGAAIVIGLGIGIIQVKYSNNLEDLWVEKGSRAADERDVYNTYFGGPGRLNLIGYSLLADKGNGNLKPTSDSDHGILTKEAFYAFSNSTVDLMFETGKYYVNKTMKSGGQDKIVQFSWKDFCSRPRFPEAFQPWTCPATATVADSITCWASQGKVGAGTLHFMTNCMGGYAANTLKFKNSTTITGTEYIQLQLWYLMSGSDVLTLTDAVFATKLAKILSRTGLPMGWGPTRAPCTRAVILDMFSDGIFDYPTELRALNNYAFSLASIKNLDTLYAMAPALFAGQYDSSGNWYSTCRATLFGGYDTSNQTAITIATLKQASDVFLSQGMGMGYWWRPSIEDQSTTNTSLSNAVFESISNAIKYPAAQCVQEGLFRKVASLSVLKANPALQTMANLTATTAINGGCAINWAGVPNTRPLFVGGLYPSDLNTTSTVRRYAAALRMSNSGYNTAYKYLLDRIKAEQVIDSITSDEAENIVRDVEQVMIDVFSDKRSRVAGSGYGPNDSPNYSSFEIYFLMDRSTNDLFDDAAKIEGKLIIGGYLGLIFFSCFNFILFRCPPDASGWVYSRAHLVFLGLCTVGAAIAASFGFCGWVGLELSPVNSTLIPFLAMGLGTGDIFVLVHEMFRHRAHQDDPQERMILTMADAGSSVLVSSWANIAAFLIPGGVIKLPAIYTFSLQMGICIILNWTTAMTMFVPCMVWNCYKTSKRGLCCKAKEDEASMTSVSLDTFWIFLAEKVLCPLYSNIFFKILAICAWIGLTVGFAIHGFTATKNGLLLSDVVLKTHYAYDYLTLQEAYFNILPGTLMTRHVDFTYNNTHVTFPDFQTNVLDVINKTSSNRFMDKINTPASLHFLPALIKSFHTTYPAFASLTTIPSAKFYEYLKYFLSADGTSYVPDLVCRNQTSKELTDCTMVDGVNITLEVTSSTVYINDLVSDQDYVDAITSIRDDADNAPGNQYPCCTGNKAKLDPVQTFYTGTLFKYWQQYVTIEDTTYRTVGYSLLGVFGVTCFTQASPLSSLLVGIMLFSTVLQLYGFMAILGIKLNGWSATNLGICVGISVQTTAYYSYAFLRAHADSDDSNERMRKALVEMFPPLLNGAITSLVSVIVLAFAKFPFFRLYFFVMIGMMLGLSFLNGVVFLPVILSFVAPKGLDRAHRAESVAMPGDGSLHNKEGKKDALENSAL